jgi:hypothetical protein
MSAFGEDNYATPFGALRPSEFFDSEGSGYYDYFGFSSRMGYFGFSGTQGFTGFSAFCQPYGIEFLPWAPTMVFPTNYEVLENVVDVIWERPMPPDVCDDDVAYEVQFTRNFSTNSGWRTLETGIPSSTKSIKFDVSNVPFTEDGGIRIRAKDSKGLCSSWSTNSVPFTIKNHPPNQVSLLSPVAKQSFDNYVLVVWNEADVKDIDGHAVFYNIQVTKSFSSDQGWTIVPGAEALVQGTVSFVINCFDFPDGDDYGIRIIVFDELGASSVPQAVGQLKIGHSGNFVIDTLAPTGTLSINDGDPLANDRRVRLSLFAKDDTTGIKDVRFRNEGETCWGDWDTYAPEKFWDLSPSDGVKTVFVQYRDYAGNVSEVCDCEIVSRVLCSEGNATDLEVFDEKLYVSFDAEGNLVEYKVLVRQAETLTEPEVTALASLGNWLYAATYDQDTNVSVFYRYNGTATRIVSLSGSKVLSMIAYKEKIYAGMEDGRIMQLDGTSLSTSYSAPSPVTRLRTDETVMLAALSGGSAFLSFDGTNWKSNTV